ncbi:MAG: hypothetical protein JWN71_3535 [Xanthobacteraceae bacterium]|nr:hypothetical protein [Xanthobacteraceae bacterium]
MLDRPSVTAASAGRVCPADYAYAPSVFDRAPDLTAETLYVVGGLYGNLDALDVIEDLAAREPAPPIIVFNGDFHWFDAQPTWFAAIDSRVARHHALRGNVESEIARAADIGAGCGCAYPATVDDGTVERSNAILSELRGVAATIPTQQSRLAALPMHLVAHVGALRIGIVHGDAGALAGWGFAQDALDDPRASGTLETIRRQSNVDVFASTHTCFAALRDLALAAGRLTVVNSGAAGMPNFSDSRAGLITRIGTTPSPHAPLYGLHRDGVHIDALAVPYDHAAFLNRFLARWPDGSPAHCSYYGRIVNGPNYLPATASRAS